MSMERRGTAGAGTIPVIFLPVTWAQGVRGPVLRRDDMRVPTRVQQSGGEPIHTAPARRGLPGGARPPPASVAGGPPASRPFVLGKASGRCVLTPWPAACFGAPTRKWFLLQRHPNRQTEPPEGSVAQSLTGRSTTENMSLCRLSRISLVRPAGGSVSYALDRSSWWHQIRRSDLLVLVRRNNQRFSRLGVKSSPGEEKAPNVGAPRRPVGAWWPESPIARNLPPLFVVIVTPPPRRTRSEAAHFATAC